MALLSIIIALLVDRVLRDAHDIRDLSWFESYSNQVSRLIPFKSGLVNIIIVLLLPLLVLLTLQIATSGFLFNLPYFIFSVLVLIYCLGPACLSSDIDAYMDARSLGDEDEALHYAGIITEQAASTVPDQQTTDVTRAILYAANDRVFSVIFWFVWLGPFGVFLYRLSTNIYKEEGHDSEMKEWALILHSLMIWIPARMLAFGYALTGHFDGALSAYNSRPYESDISITSYDTLVATGLGALKENNVSDEISAIAAARDLVMRSIMVWIAVLALLTLGGLLS